MEHENFIFHIQEPDVCSLRNPQIGGLPDALIYQIGFDGRLVFGTFLGGLLRALESQFLFAHSHTLVFLSL
jgi:hypothetical protein